MLTAPSCSLVVASEGVCGWISVLGWLLVPRYIHAFSSPYFDLSACSKQTTGNRDIWLSAVGLMIRIVFLNCAGVSITRRLSATKPRVVPPLLQWEKS
ncbi:unnamed protein product [Mycena citricolor]|uniref:Uncharacterized protein n=1 Tax=Mycena citricolor TaxID=2018698 RepID=A0AAD2HM65_9AGAR|nr:unnamed protein product [Mycena citricolor]